MCKRIRVSYVCIMYTFLSGVDVALNVGDVASVNSPTHGFPMSQIVHDCFCLGSVRRRLLLLGCGACVALGSFLSLPACSLFSCASPRRLPVTWSMAASYCFVGGQSLRCSLLNGDADGNGAARACLSFPSTLHSSPRRRSDSFATLLPSPLPVSVPLTWSPGIRRGWRVALSRAEERARTSSPPSSSPSSSSSNVGLPGDNEESEVWALVFLLHPFWS